MGVNICFYWRYFRKNVFITKNKCGEKSGIFWSPVSIGIPTSDQGPGHKLDISRVQPRAEVDLTAPEVLIVSDLLRLSCVHISSVKLFLIKKSNLCKKKKKSPSHRTIRTLLNLWIAVIFSQKQKATPRLKIFQPHEHFSNSVSSEWIKQKPKSIGNKFLQVMTLWDFIILSQNEKRQFYRLTHPDAKLVLIHFILSNIPSLFLVVITPRSV